MHEGGPDMLPAAPFAICLSTAQRALAGACKASIIAVLTFSTGVRIPPGSRHDQYF